MQDIETEELSLASVSYDEAPIAELSHAGVQYRVDVGHGSAVAISQREEGQWSWRPLIEGRWDGKRLRASSLDFELREALGRCLAEAARNQADLS